MNNSWKDGLISAHEMRNLNVSPSPEVIALIKTFLEEAKGAQKNDLKKVAIYIKDSKVIKLLPNVSSALYALGYNCFFDRG